jgi:hypothetical protein
MTFTTSKIVATYDYRDSTGQLRYRKIRTDPKSFFFERPDGARGLGNERRLLYNLAQLLSSHTALVFFAEGEKDCDRLASLGLTATTCGGAHDWRGEFAEHFRFRDVLILPHFDPPGLALAEQVARAIYPLAARVRVCVLPDLPPGGDVSNFFDSGRTVEDLLEIAASAPEWTPESTPQSSPDGAELLRDVRSFISKFVFCSDAQATILALWVMHTHTIEAVETTPYLSVTSSEKQSGKTRLLEVLESIVARPWYTGRVTAAVLIRKVAEQTPTLLLDETDAAFGGQREYAEALRGILNAGHRRGGKASLCVGQGAQISFRDFSTFSAKAIAGIGRLPDTIADRSIPVRLKRAKKGEVVARFRRREVDAESAPLRRRLESWANQAVNTLGEARPTLPDSLTDRQQDAVEPLLAIADLVAGEWPQAARRALLEIFGDGQVADDSAGVRLLADIRAVFTERGVERISSAELVEGLGAIEGAPWAEWARGRPLSTHRLARLLSRFGISPQTVRLGGSEVARGYSMADFADSWQRYLPPPPRKV